MVIFCDGKTTTISYINENGGSSRITIEKIVADNISLMNGQSLSNYIQAQVHDIRNGHKRFEKYFQHLGCTLESLTRRKMGDIIRLAALDDFANSIPDSDL